MYISVDFTVILKNILLLLLCKQENFFTQLEIVRHQFGF
jgi:hypothetical protein